jgi:hypothetical protein
VIRNISRFREERASRRFLSKDAFEESRSVVHPVGIEQFVTVLRVEIAECDCHVRGICYPVGWKSMSRCIRDWLDSLPAVT